MLISLYIISLSCEGQTYEDRIYMSSFSPDSWQNNTKRGTNVKGFFFWFFPAKKNAHGGEMGRDPEKEGKVFRP